jgi:hypothetical protein
LISLSFSPNDGYIPKTVSPAYLENLRASGEIDLDIGPGLSLHDFHDTLKVQ